MPAPPPPSSATPLPSVPAPTVQTAEDPTRALSAALDAIRAAITMQQGNTTGRMSHGEKAPAHSPPVTERHVQCMGCAGLFSRDSLNTHRSRHRHKNSTRNPCAFKNTALRLPANQRLHDMIVEGDAKGARDLAKQLWAQETVAQRTQRLLPPPAMWRHGPTSTTDAQAESTQALAAPDVGGRQSPTTDCEQVAAAPAPKQHPVDTRAPDPTGDDHGIDSRSDSRSDSSSSSDGSSSGSSDSSVKVTSPPTTAAKGGGRVRRGTGTRRGRELRRTARTTAAPSDHPQAYPTLTPTPRKRTAPPLSRSQTRSLSQRSTRPRRLSQPEHHALAPALPEACERRTQAAPSAVARRS